MNNLLTAIQTAAASLTPGDDPYSIELDTALGRVENLIYTARQAISDEWRSHRPATQGSGTITAEVLLTKLGLAKPEPIRRRI